MRTIILLALVLSCGLIACKDKQVDCSAVAVKSPCYIAFKGFADTQLHTVIRSAYRRGSNFSELVTTDTFRFPEVDLSFDTAFSSTQRAHMGLIDAGNDYKITVPAAARSFRLSDMAYTADTVTRWTATGSCGSYGTNTVMPLTVRVDGLVNTTVPLSFTNSTRWIVLQ